MEKKWEKRRQLKNKVRLFFKRVRIPLMTLSGTFLTAFVVLPLLFNGIGMAEEGEPLDVEAPAFSIAPQPTLAPPGAVQPGDDAPVENIGDDIQPPEEEPSPPQEGYAPLAFGQTDEAVKALQQRLMDLWYMESDEPTDYFGPATEAAVKRFQRSHYMKETGLADDALQRLLFSSSAKAYVIEKGYSGEDVQTIQRRLTELGYYADKTNGYFGAATFKALTAFQVKNGLEADGSADLETREHILSPQARPAVDPTDTPTPTKSPRPTRTPKATKTPRPGSEPTPTILDWDVPAGDGAGGGWIEFEPATPDPVIQNGSVSDFLQVARNQLGKPYILSTEGPDTYDCSGLVYYCLRSVGVKIGRYSANGMSQLDQWATVYGKGNMQPGDLIFYKSNGSSSNYVTHVAIWLGGDRLLHASTSAGCVCVTDWGKWSDNNFLFAKRVF